MNAPDASTVNHSAPPSPLPAMHTLPAHEAVAVVIPSYKVTRHILGVIAGIGPEVARIYVVDDKCPDGSGAFVREHCRDPRVVVLEHEVNQGVGGAVMTGYRAAIADGARVMVKIDGDGQMDGSLIPNFIAPILAGEADYTKGNRFFNLERLGAMPPLRLFGNAVLSLMTKLSSGYWDLFDPTNGFTAIHADAARYLPFDKISKRYFFESDMLFRLNILGAVVADVPMDAVYGDEESNLKVSKVLPEFLGKHASRLVKRYVYLYLLRDFNIGSLYSILGALLCLAGLIFGGLHWVQSAATGAPASSGTVMVAALPVIIGIQFLIAFLHYDVSNVPREALSPELTDEYCPLP